MEWRAASKVAGLLICLALVSSEPSAKYDEGSHSLDAALHHFDTLHVDDISHTPSVGPTHRQIAFSTLGRRFLVELEWDRHILAQDFAVYSVDSAGRREQHSIDKKAFLRGHLRDEEGSSLVTAHLSSKGVLSAVIMTPNQTYHIEPSHHYIKEPHPFHMIAYSDSHVKQRLSATRFDYAVPPLRVPPFTSEGQQLLDKKHGSVPQADRPAPRLRRQTVNTDQLAGNSCKMRLIADHTAFAMFGSDMQSASTQLVLLVSSVDKMIYRDTEWLLDVNDNTVTNTGLTIGEITVHGTPDNPYGDESLPASELLGLMRFGEGIGFCLAHLFVDRNFASGLLGLANIASPVEGQTGGICSQEFSDFNFNPPRPIIYNTGLSTYNNNGQQMVLSEMIRVTGHELGHNWGSHHDPPTEDCGNVFLMNEFAQDGREPTHMEFSECSRRSIGAVLMSKGSCFEDAPGVMCGDFLVEGDESCDVGPEGDACCTSACTLRGDAECSDRNSLCCENCQAASVSTVCRVGPPVSAACTGDTFCNGEDFDCVSPPEPAANGTLCIEGVCLFQEDSEAIECMPLCEVQGQGSLCTCVEEQFECVVCCNDTLMDSCTALPDLVPLSDHSPCSIGVCIDGQCVSQVQDQVARIWDIITSLNASAFKVFVEENIVGFTLIFSIPIWCLGSCLIHWLVDYRRMKKFERAVDKKDIGRLFLKLAGRMDRSTRSGRSIRDGASESKPLLTAEEAFLEEPVEEPVDDLPLPHGTTGSLPRITTI